MFTPEQLLALPEGEMKSALVVNLIEFQIKYAEACDLARKEGVKATIKDGVKYPTRTWQQVSEVVMPFFHERGLIFSLEFGEVKHLNENLYSITGYIYGLYKGVRVLVYSAPHIMFVDQAKYFDDKKTGIATRYIWKGWLLQGTGLADGEQDADTIPPEKVDPTVALKKAMIGRLVGKHYGSVDLVVTQINGYKMEDGWKDPETKSDIEALEQRLVADAKARN